MSTVTADQPYTMVLPSGLFRRIARAASGFGKDPEQYVLETLDATVPAETAAIDEPEWKPRLRAAQWQTEQARLAAGLTEEEIGADIDAFLKQSRHQPGFAPSLSETARG